jgi:hemerythrin-like metal-binding protein
VAIAPWNSRYETGIGLIDSQHQSLFAAVNQLADSFRKGQAQEQATASLDFLVAYALEHFQTEEQHMREIGFPGLLQHAQEHARLLEKAHALQEAHAEGLPVTMQVTIFFADWLKHHIIDMDLLYVNFLREQQAQD